MDNSYRAATGSDYDTPPPGRPLSNAVASHQRTYQACIPCRKRKVRCDLGSVDNPRDPPCVRCRRESKECYFSATRRKKKGDGDTLSDDGEETFEIKDGRKRVRAPAAEHEHDVYGDEEPPRTPGGSIGQLQPLRRPTAPKQQHYNEEDQKASEQTVGLLQTTEVHGGHDALKLLAEAARKGSRESAPRPNPSLNGVSPASMQSAGSPIIDRGAGVSYTNGPMAILQNDPMWKTPLNPTSSAVDPADTAAYNSALKAWERFRFVRAGWFRAKEAIDYIDYFYRHLAPLTPVGLLDFRSYAKHEELLTNEPMLTITILLIASRHMQLEGPGSVSRPYSIHQKLWTYLSGMIHRVLWGQEQFGGGFCGAGAEPGCDVNPLSRKGLRTLGTIESLILLTEWHPRAMHFPPDEADDELMVPSEPLHNPDFSENGIEPSKGIGGQRMDTWLEPCWRSDRMCWMLLGLSMSLAFEIGVFDESEWQRHARSYDGQPLSAEEIQRYDRRRGNVRNLLLVYVTQTSGRLGLTSMLPAHYSKPEDSALFKHLGQQESVQETDLHFWLRMASLMREGTQKLYANKAFTRDLIKNGDYKAVLQWFQEPLRKFREDFDQSTAIPKYMRYILEIEYEYARVYINALALQAVAERCANVQPSRNTGSIKSEHAPMSTNGGLRPDGAIPPQRLAKLLGGDRHYMLEVGDAARNLLKVVVYGLYPGEYLRHAPVRTYFRIISVSIVLLKSFSLGATESDVSDSLQLMDKTVEALRNCIVDDVHVASRFADLLDTLTQNLKPRLVRIAADGRTSKSRRVSHAGSPEPVPAAVGVIDPKLQNQSRQISTSGSIPNHQQWPYNHVDIANGNGNTMGPNNPLYGISNDTYDLLDQNNNFSIMPPPTFTWQSPNGANITTPGSTGMQDPYAAAGFGPDGLTEDWLAMDLNPIINSDVNQIVDVSSNMYGPQIGDTDMLELLLGSSQTPNMLGPGHGQGMMG